ncbi:MAG: hypothetical protein M3R01_07570 [Actinomycetota bacterium]|nr:hypothetical protein [Actinomycetota bacterium]
MKVEAGFVSLTEVTDPTEHRSYNEWHQLDHLPEQLTLAGIAWGQRWVSTPACRAARAVSTAPFDDVHYLTLYLLAPPLDATLEDFQLLARDLSARGRFHRHRRTALTGAFEIVGTRASPRLRLSDAAVPYRPHLGIHVRLDEVVDPHDGWFTTEHLPALVALEGVAGAWAFRRGPVAGGGAGQCVTVAWLDAPPLDVVAAIASLPDPPAGLVRPLLDGPFASIEPHRWAWFDERVADL